jgi:hypothetical protein
MRLSMLIGAPLRWGGANLSHHASFEGRFLAGYSMLFYQLFSVCGYLACFCNLFWPSVSLKIPFPKPYADARNRGDHIA